MQSDVASRQGSSPFGLLLAAAAWKRGFFAASRRAFLGDGLRSNWTVWKRYFPTFQPILDFIHALTHVYNAATAGQVPEAGWNRYGQAIRLVWSGQIDALLELMEAWWRRSVLQLRADFLSDTRPLAAFLRQRPLQATGQRPHHHSKT